MSKTAETFELDFPLEAELEAVAGLVNAGYRGREGWTTEADYLDGPRTSADILRSDLHQRPAARLLVLRDAPGGLPLGTVWLEPAGETWFLGMLTIRPGLQNRKHGRTLLSLAEAYVERQGGRRIHMTVVNIRDTLIAWYERRGYARTGETHPFPYDNAVFGVPNRDDLIFIVLEKHLTCPTGSREGGINPRADLGL